jgi:hypothetical protein
MIGQSPPVQSRLVQSPLCLFRDPFLAFKPAPEPKYPWATSSMLPALIRHIIGLGDPDGLMCAAILYPSGTVAAVGNSSPLRCRATGMPSTHAEIAAINDYKKRHGTIVRRAILVVVRTGANSHFEEFKVLCFLREAYSCCGHQEDHVF